VQPFTGAGRTLGAAAPIEVVSLLSDSDDDAPAPPPPAKAAKPAAGATPSSAAQKAAKAIAPFLRPELDSAAATGHAARRDESMVALELLGAWADVPATAVARWLLEGASASERVMTARACGGELRMRDAVTRMPAGDAYAGARCTKIAQTETAPPSPATSKAPKKEGGPPVKLQSPLGKLGSGSNPSPSLAELHAERMARQRGD